MGFSAVSWFARCDLYISHCKYTSENNFFYCFNSFKDHQSCQEILPEFLGDDIMYEVISKSYYFFRFMFSLSFDLAEEIIILILVYNQNLQI